MVEVRNMLRTHAIAHRAMAQLANTKDNPTPLTRAFFVSALLANTSKRQ